MIVIVILASVVAINATIVFVFIKSRSQPTWQLVTERDLFLKLFEVARHEKIVIAPSTSLWYSSDGTERVVGNYQTIPFAIIQLHYSMQHNPWILAHELGHHFAILKHKDKSEEAADREAITLIKQFLTDSDLHFHRSQIQRWLAPNRLSAIAN